MNYPNYEEEEYICPRCNKEKDPEYTLCSDCAKGEIMDDWISDYINENS